ncbi:hypothetical protein SJI00_13460 [Pseudomonas sp. RP23018S]|uniref:hypothetical protein n=1 Tax=Pseudomonas sp. RP23018S TaxID=3096037 RepID=UPI002ACA0ACF|nr:hypothetical protein [Pseudomonas sp. RP23018S]MDZ5603785.1 hypothetical protein [Pseudomonas sp. RP23018S]
MKRYFALAAFAALVGCSHDTPIPNTPNLDGKCDEVATFDLDFARFDEAAQDVANASGCFVKTETGQTGGIKPNRVKGEMTRREAVQALIQGTGLKVVNHQPDQVTVQ